MISQPQPAHWFRLLVAYEELPLALSVLAARQGVEPEIDHSNALPALSPELERHLHHFQQLERQYQPFWPAIKTESSTTVSGQQPLKVLEQALHALEQWRGEADPLINQLQTEEGVQFDLQTYRDLLLHLGDGPLDLSRLGGESRIGLASELFLLPVDAEVPPITEPMICRSILGEYHRYVIAIGPHQEMHTFVEAVTVAKGRVLRLPAWSVGTSQTLLPEIEQRRDHNNHQILQLKTLLEGVGRRHQIAGHLHAVAVLTWFYAVMEKAVPGQRFAQVEGWTDDGDETAINAALQRVNVRAMLDLNQTGNQNPPMILHNPWWAKPFELFPKLLGTLGSDEADPSRILFFLAPLLFGYMFGDVGQGLVLVVAGVVLRQQLQAGWLLIFGGLWSILFGFLFGAFFCNEEILSPVWLHPTQHPLLILAIPLVLGVAVILTGLLLRALEAVWQGKGNVWLQHELGVVLLYVGVALAMLHPLGWLVSGAGFLWFLWGNIVTASGIGPFFGRLAHLLETAMQLGVNSLSFARVGAFALAHAGLSQAVTTLAGLTESSFSTLLVLFFGNLLILLLEGLVVSIQTTRLILFEFFVRFLQGTGRPFRPLPPPPM